jgi:hypothetical protein
MDRSGVEYWRRRAELAERMIREGREREERRQACGRVMHAGWIGKGKGQRGRADGWTGRGAEGQRDRAGVSE